MVMAKRNSNTLYVMNSLSQIVLATLYINYDDFQNNRPILLFFVCWCVFTYDVLRTVFLLLLRSSRARRGIVQVGSTMRRGHCD